MQGFSGKNSASLGLAGGMAAQAATQQANEGGSSAVNQSKRVDNIVGGEQAATARSRGEDGRGGAAANRLEKRTHLNEAKYRIALRNYGNGLAEIGWAFISTLAPKKSGRGSSENREENETRAVRRAKSRLRQRMLASNADHLLTLTYRANMTDCDRANADLTRFVRLVRAHFPNWVYIAVPEKQKRGAWHWHMAVRGRQDVVLLRSLWLQVVGEGNIDVQPPKGEGQNRQLGLVKYLGKYLAKGFEEGHRELNGRRFRSSLGIEIPLEYLTLPKECRQNVAGYAVDHLVATTGTVGFVWVADDMPAGWACSWK
jgi:hypothetical protein